LIASCADRSDRQRIGALDTIELLAEFQIRRDLSRHRLIAYSSRNPRRMRLVIAMAISASAVKKV
jgi:hypothetical protein